ncbi:ComEA family DNA-binding protein [Demequina sp.]|uniref:ComEA family DNA-binding protein n=1 Tax=Demequina sp. TaxID=2050685 RepID=UPI0025C141F3|nr:ComEA family DNA-binding protein [Demequina sp.]
MDATGDVTARVDHALRRAAARAYGAAHGALGEGHDASQPPRWRWDVSPRVIVTLGVVAAIAGALVVWAPRPMSAMIAPSPDATVESRLPSDASVVLVSVHVAGAVLRPGVYELSVGSRVTDAIAAAGGPIDGAQLDAINLARRVTDGEQVRVPSHDDPGASVGVSADGRININTAAAAQLEDLPGVGPVLADRIVEYREQHGPFASVAALEAVAGLGPAIIAGLADSAAV